MNRSIGLACLIDALRSDAIKIFLENFDRPVVASGSVVPPFCFKPDAAYLAGLYPEESNSGTQFWYNPEASPFSMIKWAKKAFLLPYPVQLALRQAIRLVLTKRYRQSISTARIPFQFLPFFSQVWNRFPFEEGFSPSPTIFDLLRQQERRWVYLGAPVSNSKSDKIWRAFQNIPLKDISLIFILVSDLDGLGHKYGPHSVEYLNGVKKMGRFVSIVCEHLEQEYGRINGVVFGDHGMVEVRRSVNIREQLRTLPARAPKDYVYFLDSTVARFWFFSESAKNCVLKALNNVEGGRWISNKVRNYYKIRYNHNRFGEEIWWADGGTLIFPNFWQERKPVSGMHGYPREAAGNHAGFTIFGEKLSGLQGDDNEIEMVDVFPILKNLLNV